MKYVKWSVMLAAVVIFVSVVPPLTATCTGTNCKDDNAEANMSLPSYLTATSVVPSQFCKTVKRITDTTGQTFTAGGTSCTWQNESIHHSYNDQPYDSTNSYIAIQNRLATSPCNRVLLDATTLQPVDTGCTPAQGRPDDWRWSNLPALAHVQIGNRNECSNDVTRVCTMDADCTGGGTCKGYVVQYEPLSCTTIRKYPMPFVTQGVGAFDGQLLSYGGSMNAEFLALNDASGNVALLNTSLSDTEPCAVTAAASVANCGLSNCTVTGVQLFVLDGGVGFLIKYQASGSPVNPHSILWDASIDNNCPANLTLTKHIFSPTHGGGCTGLVTGEIYNLEHYDWTSNPYANEAPVLIGNEHCGRYGMSSNFVEGTEPTGHVIQLDLRTGDVHNLMDYKLCDNTGAVCTKNANCGGGGTCRQTAPAHHISTRYDQWSGSPWFGYAWVSFDNGPAYNGMRFQDELAKIKLRGPSNTGKACDRWMHLRSVYNNIFCTGSGTPYGCCTGNGTGTCSNENAETAAVPNRDGSKAIFRSNWLRDCGTGCGTIANIMTFLAYP